MVNLCELSSFCFGVKRAVCEIEKLILNGKIVYTLGDLIHNKQFCEDLKQKGVKVICNLSNLNSCKFEKNASLILRTHGVEPKVYDYCAKVKVDYFDATCPFVKRIHGIVKEQSKLGRTVLVLGDRCHPEVTAMTKYCETEPLVFSNFVQLEDFLKSNRRGKFTLVAQTTFNNFLWSSGVAKIKNTVNLNIFETICPETVRRQQAAINLAKNSSFVVVVGGKNSSNTRKLFELCSEFCQTCFVENKIELKKYLGSSKVSVDLKKVGIVSGASTPGSLIDEIYHFLNKLY